MGLLWDPFFLAHQSAIFEGMVVEISNFFVHQLWDFPCFSLAKNLHITIGCHSQLLYCWPPPFATNDGRTHPTRPSWHNPCQPLVPYCQIDALKRANTASPSFHSSKCGNQSSFFDLLSTTSNHNHQRNPSNDSLASARCLVIVESMLSNEQTSPFPSNSWK